MKREFAKSGDANHRLTLIHRVERKKGGFIWAAQCECGNTVKVSVSDFRSGHTKSCGCFRREETAERKRTHGKTETPEYRTWSHMKGRCENPTDHKYPIYGARGIVVCGRWQKFEAFLEDMGEKPSPAHSIDRIDNNGPYSPDNCRWATRHEQAQNKSTNIHVVISGQPVTMMEAERRLGISRGAITVRANREGETKQESADHFARRQVAMLGNSPVAGSA